MHNHLDEGDASVTDKNKHFKGCHARRRGACAIQFTLSLGDYAVMQTSCSSTSGVVVPLWVHEQQQQQQPLTELRLLSARVGGEKAKVWDDELGGGGGGGRGGGEEGVSPPPPCVCTISPPGPVCRLSL